MRTRGRFRPCRRRTAGPHRAIVDAETAQAAWEGGGVGPRRYEFRVSGLLSERTRGAFPDMSVADAPPQTIILGDILDESHLHGVLALIQDLGLHVVSVNEIPAPPRCGARESGRAGGERAATAAGDDRLAP
jgi:hypothetical protein